MASKRRAKAYSKRKPVVNTRWSKKQHKSYIKTLPHQKIVKFNMGDYKGFLEGRYPIKMSIVAEEDVQVRDFALEAIRLSLNRDLTKNFQKNFFLRCNAYPHNVLRNNRIFSGGSKGERVQTGMKHSFGSPEGRAALVKKGKEIFTLYFSGEENIKKVREFFKKVKPKLPCKSSIRVEKLVQATLA